MKLKPLRGNVTVKLTNDHAKRYFKKFSPRDYACGEVVTVGFEDVKQIVTEEGLVLIQKTPMVVKPGDLILFDMDHCSTWQYKGEEFYTVHQSSIYAVIEQD